MGNKWDESYDHSSLCLKRVYTGIGKKNSVDPIWFSEFRIENLEIYGGRVSSSQGKVAE